MTPKRPIGAGAFPKAVESPAPSRPDPDALYAALDLGTNSCRMLIAQPKGSGFHVVDSFSKSVQLGGEKYRHFAGRNRACAETSHGTLGCAPADGLRVEQRLADAVDVVEIVTLHLPFALGDHHATQAVTAAAIAPDEAVAVAIGAAALMGI